MQNLLMKLEVQAASCCFHIKAVMEIPFKLLLDFVLFSC